ncbi:spindle and kinetochore-associated protein 1-like isoform X3 [Pogonomyrmex barbatus]|uniref:SKA complex subunit 1 n=1 Tax=Pogonomyrmex barbatus TaxID=144034 RepID=A0A6I9W4F6_9HYME|nr:spindle and kinetochore-associated protein 1-like isoform X3 [Pogonomyrmex barbatus]
MDNLEEIIDNQVKKLQELDEATLLIKGKQNIKDELQRMHEEMLQLSYSVEKMRKLLKRMNEQNFHLKETLVLIETLDKRILHQEENVPPELIQSYQNSIILIPNTSESTVNSIHQLTTQKVCPTIPFITTEEFNKVPKYIIGRQTLDTINNLIGAINQTLIAKYTILSLGKVAAQKKGEINLYLHYKKQEFDIREENGYLYFFTAEDYYRQTKTKIDKTKLNLITALRHCKRLRECRIKNELRYIITPH